MVDVSIIIVNYKTLNLVLNCIKSVKELTKDISYEIIVVDNNSNDGIGETLPLLFQDVILIKNNTNMGFGSANNAGVKAGKGKYLFFLNSDTLLLNNCIKMFFDFMEKKEDDTIAACGGVLYNQDLSYEGSYGNFPSYKAIFFELYGLHKVFKNYYSKKLALHCKFYGDTLKYVDYIIGADLFIRKDIFISLGMFDEKYFLYFEEADLSFRLKRAGYASCIIPSAKIVHLHGKSSENSIIKLKYFFTSQFYYYKKHYKSLTSLYFLKLVYILGYLLRFISMYKIKYLKNVTIIFKIKVRSL